MDLFHSPEYRAHVEDLMKRYHVPGLAVAIVQSDKIASAGYGLASIDTTRPCTADTLFDIGSCSKSLTAAAVGLLVNDDINYPHVQYKTVVSSLLPDDFIMQGDGYTENVTVEDMLSHRTGMAP
jgi:CubicO group peptidase (beta-lactamase class C family)